MHTLSLVLSCVRNVLFLHTSPGGQVHTSDLKGAGTDAGIEVNLLGATGETGYHPLMANYDTFERGQVCATRVTIRISGPGVQQVNVCLKFQSQVCRVTGMGAESGTEMEMETQMETEMQTVPPLLYVSGSAISHTES